MFACIPFSKLLFNVPFVLQNKIHYCSTVQCCKLDELSTIKNLSNISLGFKCISEVLYSNSTCYSTKNHLYE